MQIIKYPINSIKGNPNNPRLIKDDKFEKLVKSIKEFPEMLHLRPIVVNDDMIVLGWNMRLKACREAGLTEVPVIKASDLTEEQQKEFIIKDNVSGGEWDWDILANEWDKEELEEWGLDVTFDTVEPEAEEDDFEVDEGIKTDIVLGDLFEIGEHRLLCGDSTDIVQVEKLMNGEKADMVFTDPPYWVSYTGWNKFEGWKMKSNGREMIKNDDIDLYEDAVVMCNTFCEWPVFMWFADTVCYWMYRWLEKVWAEIVALIIWKKKWWYWAMWASYKPNHEPCLIWKPKGAKLNFIWSTTENRVWEEDKEWKNKLHPTQKPVMIPARAIANHKAYKVLDLFWWSGSTMVACHQLNRKCYMSELDPKYVQTIINRMIKLDSTLIIKRNWELYV
jgi:DNA modification methylase